MPSTSAQPSKPSPRRSRLVIAGLCTPAVLAVLLFSWWPRPAAPRRPTVAPEVPGARPATDAARVLNAFEIGTLRGWVYLGEYRNARWVTRKFGGWGEGLPIAGTVINALEIVSVREAPPDSADKPAAASGELRLGEELAVVQLRVPPDGGSVWARVAALP